MSERRPSGHRTRHMPRWAESGTTLGLRGLKRHPPRCARPRRAIAPLRALAPEAGARSEWLEFRRVRPPGKSRHGLDRNTSFPPLERTSSEAFHRLSFDNLSAIGCGPKSSTPGKCPLTCIRKDNYILNVLQNNGWRTMARKRAPGGGRKPKGAAPMRSQLTIRMPDDLRTELEAAARKRGHNLTDELLWRLR